MDHRSVSPDKMPTNTIIIPIGQATLVEHTCSTPRTIIHNRTMAILSKVGTGTRSRRMQARTRAARSKFSAVDSTPQATINIKETRQAKLGTTVAKGSH
jgi:hypothetical protein